MTGCRVGAHLSTKLARLCRRPSIPPRKNIPLCRNSELRHKSRQPGPRRGAVRESFETRAGLRWTRQRRHEMGRVGRVVPVSPRPACGRAALLGFVSSVSFRLRRRSLGKLRRNGGPCVRQNRVVLAVVATVKLLRRCARAQPGGRHCQFAGRGRPEGIRLPGEHGISRPTIAQGRPSDWHHLYAAVRFFLRVHFAQRTAGARSAPGLPCALLAQEGKDEAKLGRFKPRGCEGVSARSTPPRCNFHLAICLRL